MKRTLQDKIDRAVAMRDDAFHECLDAIREVMKDNGGFVDLQGKGRAPVRARVWSGANDDYIDNAVFAVRLNGTDENGEDIIEAFCLPRLPFRISRKRMEDPAIEDTWYPLSVDDERIFPMDPVFELAYIIEDYVSRDSLGPDKDPAETPDALRKEYAERLCRIIGRHAPCIVEVEHEDGVLSDNRVKYSVKKQNDGRLLFTDLETEITFTAEDAVDGELYAIAKKLTQKN